MLLLMGNHRAQAQFDRAKWRPLALFPAWVVQLALSMTMMGLFAYRLGDTMKTYDDQEKDGGAPVVEIVWEATNVALSFVATLSTLVEIVKYYGEALTPWTMLFTHVIKLTCGIAILVLDVVVYVQRHDRHYSLVGLGLDVVFIVASCILVFISIRAFRRLSAYDDYAHPVNVKPFGFNDVEHNAPSTMDKRLSSTSSRLSLSSIRGSENPVQLKTLDRSPSQYSHKRDTQFDAYVARRGSVPGSPADLQSPQDAGVLTTRPRGKSMPRAPSWTSERGLVAVPEEEDEQHLNKELKERDSLMSISVRDSVYSIDQAPAMPQEVDLAAPKEQQR